jgi:hypothetical protein
MRNNFTEFPLMIEIIKNRKRKVGLKKKLEDVLKVTCSCSSFEEMKECSSILYYIYELNETFIYV